MKHIYLPSMRYIRKSVTRCIKLLTATIVVTSLLTVLPGVRHRGRLTSIPRWPAVIMRMNYPHHDPHHCSNLIQLNNTWTSNWHGLLTAKDSMVEIQGRTVVFPKMPPSHKFNIRRTLAGINNASHQQLACPELIETGRPQVVILVLSTASNFENRTIVRKTWGKIARDREDTLLLFVVGRPQSSIISKLLVEESRRHEDVLHVGILDIRFNVVHKELAALSWVIQNCPRTSHVFKTDDDAYVVVPNLVSFAHAQSSFKRAIYGYDAGFRRPGAGLNLGFRSKSKLPDDFAPDRCYPFEAFPPYAVMSYFFSADLIPEIITSARIGPFWAMDGDVFISGILREVAKIPLASFGAFRVAYPRYGLNWEWLSDRFREMDPIVIHTKTLAGSHAASDELTFIHQFVSTQQLLLLS